MSAEQGSQQPTVPGIRQEWHSEKEGRYFAEALIDTIREGLLVLDTSLRVETANMSFYSMFQIEEAETRGKLMYELGNGQWNIPELRQLLGRSCPTAKRLKAMRSPVILKVSARAPYC